MIKKRNKFLTVLFSFLPGAGHMFMGFFKIGVCFMSAFFLLCFLSAWLNIDSVLFILPIIWFYAFFDSINKMSLSDEEFYSLEDHYLCSLETLTIIKSNEFFKKNKLYIGIGLVILGVYLAFNNIARLFFNLLPYDSFVGHVINVISRMIPQLIITGVIIFLGIHLIIGKKSKGDK